MEDKTFLITGSNGQLAEEFQRVFLKRKISFAAPSEEECNIADFLKTREIVAAVKPNVIINCAAYNAVDEAEKKPEIAYLVNSEAVTNLAKLCKENNIFLVHYSSDYVFDGKKKDLYIEEDIPVPINVYGKSKLKGEQAQDRVPLPQQ